MNLLLYANASRETLSETLDGGAFDFPPFVAGGEVYFGLRFAVRREGVNFAKDLAVVDAYAACGSLDARPASGSTKLKIGSATSEAGVNVTAAISAPITAAALESAINALTGKPSTCDVTEDNGSFIVVFADEGDEIDWSTVENELDPVSLLRVSSYEVGNEWRYIFRFIQTPAAFASAWERIVPPAPYVERITAGSTLDDVEVDELQALVVPPDFLGTFQINRGGVLSAPLSRADGAEQIKAALDPLADEDGEFLVENRAIAEAWITFGGAMGGAPHDLLTVHVPRAPAGDVWLSMPLDHPEFFGLLRAADNVEVPFHLRVLYQDEHDEEIIHTADFLTLVTARRPLHWAGLAVAPGIDWLKKPRESYVPVPDDATITGSQHLVAAFPTSGDVGSDEFVFQHDLETNEGHWTVIRNVSPGDVLVHGTDYRVTESNDDEFTIELLPGGNVFGTPVVNGGDPTLFNLAGSGTVAALGFLKCVFSTAGPQEAISAHTQAMATVDGLVDTIADAFARIKSLEGRSGAEALPIVAAADAVAVSRPLNALFFGLRGSAPAGVAVPPSLVDYDAAAAGWRYSRLAAAVHDAAAETLPATVPAAGSSYVGRVFQTGTARETSPAGKLRVDDYVICDGLRWLRAEKSIAGADSYYPVEMDRELFQVHVLANKFTQRSDLSLLIGFEAVMLAGATRPRDKKVEGRYRLVIESGVAVAATTPGSPGANLESITWTALLVSDFYLTPTPEVHRYGITCARRLTSGSAISAAGVASTDVLTAAGHGLADGHQVTVAATAGGLTAGDIYYVRDAATDTFKLSEASGGSALDLTADATHSVTRRNIDTLTATAISGRTTAAALAAPCSGFGGTDFFLRGSLTAWDISDGAPEPAGLVLLRGLNVGWDGKADPALGVLTIG